jgi:hypothetical protein
MDVWRWMDKQKEKEKIYQMFEWQSNREKVKSKEIMCLKENK